MEVSDRALKKTEGEDAVCAAAETNLDRPHDSPILSRPGLVDELGVALHRLLELGCAAPSVREPVGDQLGPIQSDGLEEPRRVGGLALRGRPQGETVEPRQLPPTTVPFGSGAPRSGWTTNVDVCV